MLQHGARFSYREQAVVNGGVVVRRSGRPVPSVLGESMRDNPTDRRLGQGFWKDHSTRMHEDGGSGGSSGQGGSHILPPERHAMQRTPL